MSTEEPKNDPKNLSSQVRKWVEEQGYSLEMRVAKGFQENGFTVSQFDHFVDQESHSVRPVDIVATLSGDFGNSRVALKLFIECKYSVKNKPWVIVVTSDKFDKHAFFSRMLKHQHPSNWKKIDSLQDRITARMVQNMERDSSLDCFLIKNPGYVIAEAFKAQSDHAYEAIMQISKCVEAHDREAEETYKKTIHSWEQFEYQASPSQLGLFFSVAFPTVVINGQLYESYLAEDNVVEVLEIEHGTVFVPYRNRKTVPHTEIILSPVSVVTEKYLGSYIASIKQAFLSFLAQTHAINEVIWFEQSQFIDPTQEIDF